MDAEQDGVAFVQFRDDRDELVLQRLSTDGIAVGRSEENGLVFAWDREVSRFHAEFERRGGQWLIVDEGLARNGTFVDGERVVGRRRLIDGCLIRFGKTVVLFRDPAGSAGTATTQLGSVAMVAPELTATQTAVVAALCRPVLSGDRRGSTPATNQEIADELFLSVDAIKGHLRILFQKFGVADLPQNRKRAALVEKAIVAGLARSR